MISQRAFVKPLAYGVALAILGVLTIGFMAALPTPHAVYTLFRHGPTALHLYTSALELIPVMLLAVLIGRLLFRAPRQSAKLAIIACSAPWILFQAADLTRYVLTSGLPISASITNIADWQTVVALASVPLGLMLAWSWHGSSLTTGWSGRDGK